MDGPQFDEIAKTLASSTTRRALLKALASGLGASLLNSLGSKDVAAAPRISWPFNPRDGQWTIINGYRGAADHAPGCSPNNYAIFAFDFGLCLSEGIESSEGTCDLSNDWDKNSTLDTWVYSPARGRVAWIDEACETISIAVEDAPGYHVAVAHVKDRFHKGNPKKPIKVGDRITQGERIGKVGADNACFPGYHSHMVLYFVCEGCNPDTQREPIPFDGQWAIDGCPYPNDGPAEDPTQGTPNQHYGKLVPCDSRSSRRKPKIIAGPSITVDSTMATITWTTDQPTDSTVLYGERYEQRAFFPDLVTEHSVTLDRLRPETTYRARVKSKNAIGKEVASRPFTVTTLACPEGSKYCGDTCVELGTVDNCLDCGDRCDDGNPCTLDICNPQLGCDHLPLSEISCTIDGVSGVCVSGECKTDPCVGVDCSTLSDACNEGVCNAGGQCVAVPKEDGTSCGSNGETCQGGQCVPPPTNTTVTVPADREAPTDTGVDLVTGQQVQIEASGTITYCNCCGSCPTDPDGRENICGAFLCGSLVGRIGIDGPEFAVGSSVRFAAGVSGRLFLRVFDRPGAYIDNAGFFEAIVTVG